MRNSLSIVAFSAVVSVLIVLTGTVVEAAEPSIEGSYILEKRVLPDGTEQTPPDVVGFATWTDSHRNFNVSWLDDQGRRVSIALVAAYTLTPEEYCEDVSYWMASNLETEGVSYEPPAGKSECAAVTVEDGTVRMDLPGEPPSVSISDEGITATAEEMFVDHWKKVE